MTTKEKLDAISREMYGKDYRDIMADAPLRAGNDFKPAKKPSKESEVVFKEYLKRYAV